MRTVFIDSQLEDSFTNDGYCVVDLFNSSELELLQNFIYEFGYGTDNEEKFRKSIIQETSERRREFFEKILPIAQNPIKNILQNYKIIQISIFDKLPGGKSIKLHQHTSIVDETKYCSLTTWIPLAETSVEMGTLHVIKGSHKIFTQPRSFEDYNMFDHVSEKAKEKFCTPLLLKAGQAVIFDDRLIHASPPNKTSEIRTAIRLQLIPREVDLEVHYRINDQEMMKYAFDDNLYPEILVADVNPANLTEIEKIRQPTLHYNTRKFSSILQSFHSDSTNQKRNFFQRLFGY